MKRAVFVAVLALGAVFLFGANNAHAALNDFYFKSFDADYYLSKDTEDRSTLRVEERLVAVFPDYDQNHGIERAIPDSYDGHPVNLKIVSVKDASGNNLKYSVYGASDNTVLRIGDANKYVRGEQSYYITYTMRDVTANYDTGDEFFWDTNGTGWQQTFNSLSATLHIDNSLADAFDGRYNCFSGVYGQNTGNCTITLNKSPQETTLAAESNRFLAPGENISIIAGFKSGTFAPYVAPPLSIWQILGLIALAIFIPLWYIVMPVWLFFWGLSKWRQAGRDKKQQTTIVPQYIPPKDISVLTSDLIIHTQMSPKAVSATIISLAVRHYLKIYDLKKNKYEVELTKNPKDLNADDRKVLEIIFENNLQIGAKTELKQKSSIYKAVEDLKKDTYTNAISTGYMVDTRNVQKKMYWAGGILLFLSIITLNIFGLIAASTVLIFAGFMPARTVKGVETKTYLDGTKMYMEVAEKERFKAMQSADTAERLDVSDEKQLIKIYERLLPLAMLYGIEKSWVKEFAHLYHDTSPDWYVGNKAFTAAVLANSINSFGSTTAANTFSPPASSGSSGFSSGGGFSGGGGGGGGGGGW